MSDLVCLENFLLHVMAISCEFISVQIGLNIINPLWHQAFNYTAEVHGKTNNLPSFLRQKHTKGKLRNCICCYCLQGNHGSNEVGLHC